MRQGRHDFEGGDAVPADLGGVLARARGSAFARDENAPRALKAAFRPLAWQDVAMHVPLDAPLAEGAHESADASVGEPAEERPAQPEQGVTEHVPEAMPAPESDAGPDVVPSAEPAHTLVPQIDEAALQQMRDEAYAEGLSAGKAMTESEREAELSAQFERLGAIIGALDAEDLLDREALARGIQAAVLELASQRVGLALDDMPELMMARLESVLARLDHLAGLRELFVAPEDLGLVQMAFEARGGITEVQLRGDPNLRRGDARLRVGGAEIADLLTPDEQV